MNEFYKEILVKRPVTGLDQLKKILMIALAAVFMAGGLFVHPLLMLPAIGAAVLAWYVITGLDCEYEYLYVNGDFDIDKIMNKQRRKRVASYSLEEMEMIAPAGSHDLDPYTSKGASQKDYTSGNPKAGIYTAVYNQSGGTQLVKLELDDDVLRDLRRLAPRKVSRDILFIPG